MKLQQLAVVTQGLVVSGRGAGARPGGWRLSVVESADIEDDRLMLGNLKIIGVEESVRTEKHLLRPHDVLVTARSHTVKVALVPPNVTRTVAASTLLVVRPDRPEIGAGHFLWYYLTSKNGRSVIEKSVRVGASIPSLPASALADIDVPLPPVRELSRISDLVEESERAYEAGMRAARMRREVLRDAIIRQVTNQAVDPE